jgi:peptidyl-prolyl cis-trans isomerase B (cyclophilin B)
MSESNPAPAGEEIAVMQTNLGTITLKFFPELAPKHVESFKKLARSGYFDGTKFHRVIPGFMIQGGDPNSKSDDRSRHGTGGPGYTVPAEFNSTLHDRGILSAARTSDPNSAGSQFFLMVARAPHLDNQYTVYGQVIEGMEVIDKIVALPRDSRDNPKPENPAIIEKVTIEAGS